ncbi:hypothetical protein L1R05_27285 [Klebsiella pneumoniae]
MEKFLYLTQYSWSEAWIKGGEVPLSSSSTYRSAERKGILTPDENILDSSTHDIKSLEPYILFDEGSLSVGRLIVNDELIGENINLNRRYEDGLVLCFANRRSNYIAKKLNKVAFVKIFDVLYLKSVLDQQIGVESMIGPCEYTKDHRRGHFLKSEYDRWQDEYRMFWPGVESRSVIIPKGISCQVKIRGDLRDNLLVKNISE